MHKGTFVSTFGNPFFFYFYFNILKKKGCCYHELTSNPFLRAFNYGCGLYQKIEISSYLSTKKGKYHTKAIIAINKQYIFFNGYNMYEIVTAFK